jgi:hypothetical protein
VSGLSESSAMLVVKTSEGICPAWSARSSRSTCACLDVHGDDIDGTGRDMDDFRSGKWQGWFTHLMLVVATNLALGGPRIGTPW